METIIYFLWCLAVNLFFEVLLVNFLTCTFLTYYKWNLSGSHWSGARRRWRWHSGRNIYRLRECFFFLELAIRAVVLVFSLHWTCLLIFLKLFENKNLFHAYVFNCSCSDLQNCLLDPLIQILLSRRLPYLQYNRLNPLMN